MLNDINEARVSLYDKVVMIVLLLYSILNIYGVEAMTIAEGLTIILLGVGLLTNKLSFKLTKYIRFYLIYMCLVIVVSADFNFNWISRLIGVAYTYLTFSLFYSRINLTYFLKVYRILSLFFICFFFIQEVSFATIGTRPVGIIPFLPVVSDLGTDDFSSHLSIASRSSSFFSEPAHFAQFLLPLLAYEVFMRKGCDRNLIVLMISVTILMLLSGNGIIGFGVLLCYYIWNYTKSVKKTYRYLAIIVIAGLVSIGITYYMSSESGQVLLNRTNELTLADPEVGSESGFVRIYRGYFVYDNLNLFEKIVGLGNFERLRERIVTSSVGWTFDDNDNYFNVIQNVLIRTGILGMIIMLLFLFKDLWHKNNACAKSLVLVFFTFSFMSNLYLTPTMILYTIIPYCLKFKKEKFI